MFNTLSGVNKNNNATINSKIEVTFIIPSLRAGGAERVMSYIATHLDKERFVCHLLIVGKEEDSTYKIDDINIVYLNKSKVRFGIVPIIKYLVKNKMDIVVSAIGHLNMGMALVAPLFPKTAFISRETSIPAANNSARFKLDHRKILNKLKPVTLDAIICQSEDMALNLIKNYNYPEKKIVIINNPISENFKVKSKIQNETKQLITIGRLVKVKGHVRILSVLSHLEIPFHYTIIGSGPEKKNIKQKVEELNLGDHVTFIKHTNEVEKYLAKSDIFLQGSYSEGFPNALLESCAVGTPVIAFNAFGGTREIIQDGINGHIALNENEYLHKINLTLNTSWNPDEIRNSVMERYSALNILSKYEKLFQAMVK